MGFGRRQHRVLVHLDLLSNRRRLHCRHARPMVVFPRLPGVQRARRRVALVLTCPRENLASGTGHARAIAHWQGPWASERSSAARIMNHGATAGRVGSDTLGASSCMINYGY